MLTSYHKFKTNISETRNLHILVNTIRSAITAPIDLDDILRAELTFSISALDKFIHDFVKAGMIDIFNGRRASTSAYDAFQIKNTTLAAIRNSTPTSIPTADYWFSLEILQKHKIISFQEPDKINLGLNLISNKQYKWQLIASRLSLTEHDVKSKLKAIVDRRNYIVHEFDIDSSSNSKFTISLTDVMQTVDFIEKLGDSIHDEFISA